jgi:hypothetical protein
MMTEFNAENTLIFEMQTCLLRAAFDLDEERRS